QRMRRKDCVGVERDDDLSPNVSQCEIQRLGLSGIGSGEQAHLWDVAEPIAYDVTGAVLRAVVDDDDFEARVCGPEQAGDGLRNNSFFVVSRDDDRDEWSFSRPSTSLFPPSLTRTSQLREGQRADENNTSQTERDADQKHPLERPAADRHGVKR